MIKEIKTIIGYLGAPVFLLLLFFVINPFDKGIFLLYPLALLLLFKPEFLKRNLDLDSVFLILFCITFGLFYALNPAAGIQFIVFYSIFPVILYFWGKYIALKSSLTQLTLIAVLVGVIFSFNALFSVSIDIINKGFQSSRDIPMYWAVNSKNATGTSAYFVFAMCLPSIVMADKRFGSIFKIVLIAIFMLAFLCILRLGSRTQIAIAIFTFLISLFYLMPKQSIKRNIAVITILVGIGIIIYQNVSFNLDADWLAAFETRLRSGENNISTAGKRTNLWQNAINNFIQNPLGWEPKGYAFAHNLWLEIARLGGFIPFILFVIISIRSILLLWKVVLKKNIDNVIKVLFLTNILSIYLVFMVEPIIVGSINLFLIYCFFIGMFHGLDKKITARHP